MKLKDRVAKLEKFKDFYFEMGEAISAEHIEIRIYRKNGGFDSFRLPAIIDVLLNHLGLEMEGVPPKGRECRLKKRTHKKEEVYIELLEGEVEVVPGYPEKHGKPHIDHYAKGCACYSCLDLARKEKQAKPKEEWVDVTGEIEWEYRAEVLWGKHKRNVVLQCGTNGIFLTAWAKDIQSYKLKSMGSAVKASAFRVLKKVTE